MHIFMKEPKLRDVKFEEPQAFLKDYFPSPMEVLFSLQAKSLTTSLMYLTANKTPGNDL